MCGAVGEGGGWTCVLFAPPAIMNHHYPIAPFSIRPYDVSQGHPMTSSGGHHDASGKLFSEQ